MYVIHKYIHVNKYAPINASIYTNYINIYIYHITTRLEFETSSEACVGVRVCVCVWQEKSRILC